MISHGKDIKVFSGNSNPKLANEICRLMGTKLGESEVGTFSDGEIFASMYETVRGSDVFLIQSTCSPVNDNLMELLIMVDAMKRASAGRITAVIPYFGYARQDRKAKSRDPISAKLVANMVVASGADRVLTMDLHASQIQGFFDVPVDVLLGNPIFVDYYAKKFGSKCEDMIVVSPDVGSHCGQAAAEGQPVRGDERHRRRGRQGVHHLRRHGGHGGEPLQRGQGHYGGGRRHEGLCLRLPRGPLRSGY